jgi:hypothetical protein
VSQRKAFLLRLTPDLHQALERWAQDELRSVNAQIEYLLAQAVRQAGRARGSGAPPMTVHDAARPEGPPDEPPTDPDVAPDATGIP